MTASASPPIVARSPARPTVILLDDDDAVREALKFSLEAEGYKVVACRTGEQLVGLELPEAAACLVLDYKLHGLNGLEALETLRGRGVELPAILITSFANPLLHTRARRARATVVEKPLLGDALLRRINDILSLR